MFISHSFHFRFFVFVGIYSWIGVNFELGRFDHSHESTGTFM